MKFALINNEKTEAFKGAKGICPGCGSELIAKCGNVKIQHWAHKGSRICDPWWENETEWHRSWKNNFPNEWQEIPLVDKVTKEIHIADIQTDQGLIVEFQHSHIEPSERIAREKFYKNMIWIVDGTRLKRDHSRFLKGKEHNFGKTDNDKIFHLMFADECFPTAWIASSVPVVFDFKGVQSTGELEDSRNLLYCLFPKKNGKGPLVAELPRKAFIKSILLGEWSTRVRNYFDKLKEEEKLRQAQEAHARDQYLQRMARLGAGQPLFMGQGGTRKKRTWF